MKKFIFPSLCIALLLIGGCQSNKNANQSASYDLRKDRNVQNMSNRLDNGDRKLDGNDITNQNPNFLNLQGTRNGSASGGSGNIGVDTDYAKKIIADTNEFTTDSIWVNGDRMWVKVYKKGILSHKQRIDAEARLHKKLVQALPRYNIEVRVQESRR